MWKKKVIKPEWVPGAYRKNIHQKQYRSWTLQTS